MDQQLFGSVVALIVCALLAVCLIKTDWINKLIGYKWIRAGMLCDQCRVLSIDLLSRNIQHNTRWKVVHSDFTTLTQFLDHYDPNLPKLRQSADAGCVLCAEIARILLDISKHGCPTAYCLFVWGTAPESYEIQVGDVEVTEYVQPLSKRPACWTLEYFARATRSVNLSTPGLPEHVLDTSSMRLLAEEDPKSREVYEKARSWLNECVTGHSSCIRSRGKLPKRVLDVGDSQHTGAVSLYITKIGEEGEYIALSYMWGQTARLMTRRRPGAGDRSEDEPNCLEIKRLKPTGLQDSKYEDLGSCKPTNIPLAMFPRTQRDAINTTRILGYRYLWIDSLCIIQGDEKDWAHQAKLMTNIYSGASLTLSASSTVNTEGGIFAPVRCKQTKLSPLPGICHAQMDIFVGKPLTILDLAEKPISTRGWIFQETLVSVATLHYTDEGMVWECRHGLSTGHHQSLSSNKWKSKWRDLMHGQVSMASKPAVKRGFSSHYDLWYDFVCSYSSRELFEPKDKLPAMAGVAKKFAEQFQLGNDAYVAGLWKEDFLTGLLWRREFETNTLSRRDQTSDYIGPSWSWASVQGLLEHRKVDLCDSKWKGPKLKVLHCHTTERVPGTYGEVSSAILTVQGLVQKIMIDQSIRPGERKKGHQACGVSEGFLNTTNILCTLDEPDGNIAVVYQCWCLRVGSFAVNGREGDAFLVLQKSSGADDLYKRIGYVEADGWFDRLVETPDSGRFKNAALKTIHIA